MGLVPPCPQQYSTVPLLPAIKIKLFKVSLQFPKLIYELGN